MRTISKRIRYQLLSFLAAIAFFQPSAVSGETALENTGLVIKAQNNRIVARDGRSGKVYVFDAPAASHLKRSDEIIPMPYNSNVPKPNVIVLAREPSRPQNKGLGYCGAGHEDILLLLEIARQKLVLRDKLVLQSCLDGRLIYRDNGEENPLKLLVPENDGSFSFSWEGDDPEEVRNLAIKQRRFVITSRPLNAK